MIPRVVAGLGAAFAAVALTAPAPAAPAAPVHRATARTARAPLTGTGPLVEATAAARLGAPLRSTVDLASQVPVARQRAWAPLAAAGWQATWDRATGVPSRLWGPGPRVAGSVRDPDIAARAAWAALATYLPLLAPGAAPGDFTLVGNASDGDLRTVGFAQHHRGLAVIGGQVSFRFKHDRLFVMASEALPAVDVGATLRLRRVDDLVERARAATAADLGVRDAVAGAAGAAVIVPLVSDDAVLGYRVAVPVDVSAGAGRWTVYTDPSSGAPLVRVQQHRSATGTVRFTIPTRYPGSGRSPRAAPRAFVRIAGADLITGDDGVVEWSPDGAVDATVQPRGDLVTVLDGDTNTGGTTTLPLQPDGELVWDVATVEGLEAQLTTFVHANVVKAHVRSFAPDLALLDQELIARVNFVPPGDDVSKSCNAFFSADTGGLYFFKRDGDCENTGLIADVVYHEFGHAMHFAAIIPGAGAFDGAFSEGLSDFLAASITADAGMARGFFFDDRALRDLDPVGSEAIWPRDIGEIHTTGLIFGGAMWDLRKALIASLGEVEGAALTLRLYYAAVQRASNIPATLIEILAADDDDGDLGNGTPNECLIRAAFIAHGLRTSTVAVTAGGRVTPAADTTTSPIAITVSGLDTRCGTETVSGVDVFWAPRGDGTGPQAGSAAATAAGDNSWQASVPLPPEGEVVRYRAEVRYDDGLELLLPTNPADRWFELYHGDVIELYCTGFEEDPFAAGWTHGTDRGADDWQWGPPSGGASAIDPPVAAAGTGVLGTDLGSSDDGGTYTPESTMWARSPVIDLEHYSDVRLQYRRWLSVEDGFFDDALIRANDVIAWQNADSDQGDSSSIHHVDAEWRFHDVPLSPFLTSTNLELSFELVTDPGLHLGGWSLDELCVVANPRSICGDGEITGPEECDDAASNADVADACRSICRLPVCGDRIVDGDETCDDGNEVVGDGCDLACQLPEDGGCCSANRRPGDAALPLLLIALALGWTRRRRHAGAQIR